MNVKEKIGNIRKLFFQKYWIDPVWSKVISTAIIGLVTAIYIIAKSIYEKVPFSSVAMQVLRYFQSTIEINIFLIWIALFIISWSLVSFIKSTLKKIRVHKSEIGLDSNEKKELPIIREHSTVFFSYRLASAFPGQRGLKWYDSKTAVQRLKIVFQDPIDFNTNTNFENVSDPLWWFRGQRAMFIKKFRPLSKSRILLGVDELEISRIAVFVSDSYYKCYVYVEAKGEKPIGLYNQTEEAINSSIEHFGYSSEEYALLGKRPIRREDYDDGATIIKGKVVDAFGAELRVRYLSNYNFILAAKQSPYNSGRFDRESQDYFNKILKKEIMPETFFEFLETFNKYED